MNRYLVEHEFDDEATVVVNDDTDEVVAEFPPVLPWTVRVVLAQQVADALMAQEGEQDA